MDITGIIIELLQFCACGLVVAGAILGTVLMAMPAPDRDRAIPRGKASDRVAVAEAEHPEVLA